MKSAEPFSKLANLKRLDISEHPEFFMTEEKKEQLECAELQGLPSEQKEGVEFSAWNITIDDILAHFKNLEEIICD